jgi:HD-GYP domain-containing protein (c-di-GMP phosphodiesterase class II)
MRDTILTKDLQIGMYILLPASWLKPPFMGHDFKITSQDQIDQIINYGLATIVIDTAKGIGAQTAPPQPSNAAPESTPPATWEPDKLVPAELREAIHDKKLAPEKKSRIVYQCSLELMGKLLDDPRTENIREAKAGIAEMVDLIISDDATSAALLKITSYDYYTYTHSVNVGFFSVLLAKELFKGSDAHNMHELGAGFFLHDIGKVRIDPAIINKPGKLTDDEMTVIRTHPGQGYRLLAETKHLTEECKIIVLQHHERQDGTGYPQKLTGDGIHIYGRICSIADVYDALTAERSYKKKMDTFSALKLMKEQLLNHFNQELFEKFVMLFARSRA